MRIISDFKDYYDSGMGLDHEKDPLYLRKHEEDNILYSDLPESIRQSANCSTIDLSFGLRTEIVLPPSPTQPYYDRQTFSPRFLLFCGKAYGFWSSTGTTTEEMFQLILEDRQNKRRLRTPSMDSYLLPFGLPVAHDLHVRFNSPILLIGGFQRMVFGYQARIHINPSLSRLRFYRFFDPFAAYQEIQTFIGSVLVQHDQAPQRVGSDEVIAAQKGFDPKYSFRTLPPGRKKENRKLNRARKKKVDPG